MTDTQNRSVGHRPPRSEPRGLDVGRAFGTHIRMGWWRPMVLIVALPVTLLLSQLALYLLAGVVEGSSDPFAPTLTPLKLLAANLSTGLTALLAVVLTSRLAGVRWRSVFSSSRRFDPRRVATYLAGSVVLVAAGVGVVGLVAPEAAGWVGFSISATTLAMLVVVVLSTPVQAAGEEVIFRGALLPAAGSWFCAVRPAFVSGLVVSSLLFALVHATSDPWLFGYYLFLSAGTALMGLITRGLEAAVAFHVANNLVTTTVNTLLAGGGALVVDRSEGSGGGPSLLVLAAVNLAVLGLVWMRERRRRRP